MSIAPSRWREAQEFEKAHWKRFKAGYVYDYEEAVQTWQRILSYVGMSLDSFQHRLVVEVGSGTGSMEYGIGAHIKIAVDPLMSFCQAEGYFSKRADSVRRICAVGESVPLQSQVAEIVVCRNVLDHVHEPFTVLEEINRLLIPGGKLLLVVHILRSAIFLPLRPIFDVFDRPHPFHFTDRDMCHLFERTNFRIASKRIIPGIGGFSPAWKDYLNPRRYKMLGGNMILARAYYLLSRCEKV